MGRPTDIQSSDRISMPVSPIVVTAKGVVVDGHARLAVARELGVAEMPAVVVRHPDLRVSLREEC
jgi:ParB-like chromosome segregation protein Spo0J